MTTESNDPEEKKAEPEPKIFFIKREHVSNAAVLRDIIYPNDALECFVTDDWSPEMFYSLARAGFITISHPFADGLSLLVSQIHTHFSVLDWENISEDMGVKKVLRKGIIDSLDIHLKINTNPRMACEGVAECHGKKSWMTDEYMELMQSFAGENPYGIRTLGIELWARGASEPICGEVGYIIGATYTSLTSFQNQQISPCGLLR